MYHLSSPRDLDGNFDSMIWKSVRASSFVGSRGIGSSVVVMVERLNWMCELFIEDDVGFGLCMEF